MRIRCALCRLPCKGCHTMKSKETVRLERSEFRKAVERARKTYGEWLEKDKAGSRHTVEAEEN